MSVVIRNEQTKLLASAINNLGVAFLVTGVIAPVTGYMLGSLAVDAPLRLLSFVMICLVGGALLLHRARRTLEAME